MASNWNINTATSLVMLTLLASSSRYLTFSSLFNICSETPGATIIPEFAACNALPKYYTNCGSSFLQFIPPIIFWFQAVSICSQSLGMLGYDHDGIAVVDLVPGYFTMVVENNIHSHGQGNR